MNRIAAEYGILQWIVIDYCGSYILIVDFDLILSFLFSM